MAMNITAITTQVVRQPTLPRSIWVNGRKKTPPMPTPLTAKAKAMPRLRWNHLATGTEVMMFCGAASPVKPNTPKRAITCHGVLARLTANSATPMIAPDTGIITRGP